MSISEQATPEIWARYVTELLRAGRHDQAGEYLRRAREGGWTDRQTLLAESMLAMRSQDFALAETRLGELLRQAPGSPAILAMLAEAQKDGGKLTEAEATLRRAMEDGESPE